MTPARVSVWAAALIALTAGAVRALDVPPRPLGRVSDFAGLLSPGERARIEQRLEEIERATSNQFAVAIFPSLEGESLEDFSIRLAETWKIGQAGRDNGVILLVFLKERRIRIEVGYGLEGAIPDAVAGRIIRNVLAPRFRQQDYVGGLLAAIDALDAASRGEFGPMARSPTSRSPPPDYLVFLLPGLLFVVMFLGALARRSTVIGRRGGGFWWFGPGFGGGWGGGGGGFSGGGGGFGGGGASGGW